MKIYVIGTGGMGGYYGGMLARAGADVTFIARGAHYQAIAKDGLKVDSATGNFTIHPAKVISSIAEIEAPDMVLITTKAYDNEEVSKQLAQVVNKDTVVISLQNGIDNDQQIQKHLKNAIVIPGCAYIITEKAAAGYILQTGGPRKVVFGSRDHTHQNRLAEIEKVMQNAGIDAKNSQEIEKDIWTKFLVIIGFAGMTSICRSPVGLIVNEPGAFRFINVAWQKCLKSLKNQAFLWAKKNFKK